MEKKIKLDELMFQAIEIAFEVEREDCSFDYEYGSIKGTERVYDDQITGISSIKLVPRRQSSFSPDIDNRNLTEMKLKDFILEYCDLDEEEIKGGK